MKKNILVLILFYIISIDGTFASIIFQEEAWVVTWKESVSCDNMEFIWYECSICYENNSIQSWDPISWFSTIKNNLDNNINLFTELPRSKFYPWSSISNYFDSSSYPKYIYKNTPVLQWEIVKISNHNVSIYNINSLDNWTHLWIIYQEFPYSMWVKVYSKNACTSFKKSWSIDLSSANSKNTSKIQDNDFSVEVSFDKEIVNINQKIDVSIEVRDLDLNPWNKWYLTISAWNNWIDAIQNWKKIEWNFHTVEINENNIDSKIKIEDAFSFTKTGNFNVMIFKYSWWEDLDLKTPDWWTYWFKNIYVADTSKLDLTIDKKFNTLNLNSVKNRAKIYRTLHLAIKKKLQKNWAYDKNSLNILKYVLWRVHDEYVKAINEL